MVGWIYLVLSVTFSVAIAHLLKLVEFRRENTLNVLTVNYAVAVLLAAGINAINNEPIVPDFPWLMWGLAVFIGVLFIANFFVYSKSIHENGVGISITAMRLSLLLPVLLSVVIYGEPVTYWRIIGILLVISSMIMLVASRWHLRLSGLNSHWLLVVIFLMTGIADGSMKIFEQEGLMHASEAHYLGIVFLTAFFVGLIAVIYRGSYRMNYTQFRIGLGVGFSNLLTSFFLIKALQHIDGTVVYSAVNVLTVLAGVGIGIGYWKDRVSGLQAIGIALALLAIVILV